MFPDAGGLLCRRRRLLLSVSPLSYLAHRFCVMNLASIGVLFLSWKPRSVKPHDGIRTHHCRLRAIICLVLTCAPPATCPAPLFGKSTPKIHSPPRKSNVNMLQIRLRNRVYDESTPNPAELSSKALKREAFSSRSIKIGTQQQNRGLHLGNFKRTSRVNLVEPPLPVRNLQMWKNYLRGPRSNKPCSHSLGISVTSSSEQSSSSSRTTLASLASTTGAPLGVLYRLRDKQSLMTFKKPYDYNHKAQLLKYCNDISLTSLVLATKDYLQQSSSIYYTGISTTIRNYPFGFGICSFESIQRKNMISTLPHSKLASIEPDPTRLRSERHRGHDFYLPTTLTLLTVSVNPAIKKSVTELMWQILTESTIGYDIQFQFNSATFVKPISLDIKHHHDLKMWSIHLMVKSYVFLCSWILKLNSSKAFVAYAQQCNG